MRIKEKVEKLEKIQTRVVIALLVILVASIPFVCKRSKPVATAYNSYCNSLRVFDLDEWEYSLNGLIAGANDADFVKSVNSYQDRVQYLKKLELAEEPYFAESMALKEAMQSEITISRTYKAWGNWDPNLVPIIYVCILLVIVIAMFVLRLKIEVMKKETEKKE